MLTARCTDSSYITADNAAVPVIADVSEALMRDHFNYTGFDWAAALDGKQRGEVMQENIVNFGLKDRLFDRAINTTAAASASTSQRVVSVPLTSASFSAFGDVFDPPGNDAATPFESNRKTSVCNDGTALKYNHLVKMANERDGRMGSAAANVSIFQCQARAVDSKGIFSVGSASDLVVAVMFESTHPISPIQYATSICPAVNDDGASPLLGADVRARAHRRHRRRRRALRRLCRRGARRRS
jgi:hypothetical protein